MNATTSHAMLRKYPLGSGWTLAPDGVNDRGTHDWIVTSPGHLGTASLSAASEYGVVCADNGRETKIPKPAMKELDRLEVKLAAEGLY